METWRVVATVLFAAAGLPLVLVLMAKARDRTDRSGTVAITGAVAFVVLLLLGVVMLTVLPGVLTWSLLGLIVAALGVMMLAS
ncbi:hypothetical protein ACFORH_40970 [Amycolatopsis roodepoortensis]|uniref:Protein-S-isoprenylcysteine O-methyltransferase Ste14 n=1 Tax=Amycolatopsis roodepoortensis TaxID=700274 RepID=A0ABR9L854_9PSEU|nr:hypothetical protein [Amycolatopsis roodepoortensis]MBE1576864.1 protein-S-isoprenylcysteine O-methyltransferase Ste14 [Amycolatopsis roodepoortensis]